MAENPTANLWGNVAASRDRRSSSVPRQRATRDESPGRAMSYAESVAAEDNHEAWITPLAIARYEYMFVYR